MQKLIKGNRIVWILGLMHSGTTIVWRSFRKDKRFLCFDEPFSGLDVLPGQNSRKSYGELINIFERNPRHFWKKYAPLYPLDELDNTFTNGQVEYLQFLLNQGDSLVIDETHLHTHIESLKKITPSANVMHIYRRASCFATSHLRPSFSKNTSWERRVALIIRNEYYKKVFWKRYDFVPGLHRHMTIGNNPQSKFGLMLDDAGYDSERIMSSPTLVRLLAYWHYHYHYLEKEGPRLFGDRFRSLRYEDFAIEPTETMNELYQWFGLDEPEGVSYSDVYAPKPAFRFSDRRWREAARIAGFSEEEIETLL